MNRDEYAQYEIQAAPEVQEAVRDTIIDALNGGMSAADAVQAAVLKHGPLPGRDAEWFQKAAQGWANYAAYTGKPIAKPGGYDHAA